MDVSRGPAESRDHFFNTGKLNPVESCIVAYDCVTRHKDPLRRGTGTIFGMESTLANKVLSACENCLKKN